jgi:hypothetical protein
MALRMLDAPLRGFGLAAGLVALAISGLFGGLDEAKAPKLPTIGMNTVFDGGPWKVNVKRARLVSDLSPLKLKTEGNRWLGIVATVEVTADETRFGDLKDILRVHGAEGLAKPEPDHVNLLRDATELPYLQPGLPEDVGFVWEQAGSAPVPKEITVEIYGKTLRVDSLSVNCGGVASPCRGNLEWLDPVPVARVPLSVEDRRT